MQAGRFQEQQREEQDRLETERRPARAPAARDWGSMKASVDRDVGVRAMLAGVGVVAVVLADPPAIAQPDAQVAEQDADDLASLPGTEDLPVPGVVAREARPG